MKIVVGISGASGIPLAKRLLEVLKENGIEAHLIVSDSAKKVMEHEGQLGEAKRPTGAKPQFGTECGELEKLATKVYDVSDISAAVSSGSFRTDGMVVVPCSMKTLAGLASGYSDNLILRAGDVCLKEGRKLVVVPRETPLSYIHIKNMLTLKQAGAVILPPVVAFYQKPKTLEDMVNFIVGKILDALGIDNENFKRWGDNGHV